jgi:hypothetical protein
MAVTATLPTQDIQRLIAPRRPGATRMVATVASTRPPCRPLLALPPPVQPSEQPNEEEDALQETRLIPRFFIFFDTEEYNENIFIGG